MKLNNYKLFVLLLLCGVCNGVFGQIDGCTLFLDRSISSNIIYNTNCVDNYSPLDATLVSNSGNYQLIIGTTESTSTNVLIDYPELYLSGSTLDDGSGNQVEAFGIQLIVNDSDSLIISGDLKLNNYSSIKIEKNGVLIIGGSLLTNNEEESLGVVIEIDQEGEVHVGGDALLNFATGELNNNLFVTGSVTVKKLASLGLLEKFFLRILAGVAEYLGNTDLANQIRDGLNGADIGFENSDISGPKDPGNPFDNNSVNIVLPITASALEYFSSTDENGNDYSNPEYRDFISAPKQIFTAAEIEKVLSNGSIMSLLNNNISILVKTDSIKDGLTISTTAVNSIASLKNVLQSITWTIPNNIRTALMRRNRSKVDGVPTFGKPTNNPYIQEHQDLLKHYFVDKQIRIYIQSETSDITVDPDLGQGSSSRIAATTNDNEVVTIKFNMDNATDLPVNLTYFNAFKENNTVILEWETASEQNSSHFDIQRSVDRKKWITLGTEQAAGNSNVALFYNFIDEQALVSAYYRLYQVDFDGKNEYFGPLFVGGNGQENALDAVIIPNNISLGEAVKVNINGISEGTDILILIYNSNGHQIYQEKVEEVTSSSILRALSLPSYVTSGMYYVVIQSGRNAVKERLLVR